jgi:hypothetical protein
VVRAERALADLQRLAEAVAGGRELAALREDPAEDGQRLGAHVVVAVPADPRPGGTGLSLGRC